MRREYFISVTPDIDSCFKLTIVVNETSTIAHVTEGDGKNRGCVAISIDEGEGRQYKELTLVACQINNPSGDEYNLSKEYNSIGMVDVEGNTYSVYKKNS